MLIYGASQGDPAVWGQLLASKASQPTAETMAWGMHFSVECAEHWAFETPQDLVRASAGLHPAIREAVVRSFADTFWVCERWYVFPYLGHTDGFASSCHASVLSAFLDHPDRQPDGACIEQMDRPVFVVP